MALGRDDARTWAACFQALGEPSRILILHLLATSGRPMTVGEITEALDIAQSTVSHHLKKLADVRFVLVDHNRNSSYYRVNGQCLEAFPTAAQLVMGHVPLTSSAPTEGEQQ